MIYTQAERTEMASKTVHHAFLGYVRTVVGDIVSNASVAAHTSDYATRNSMRFVIRLKLVEALEKLDACDAADEPAPVAEAAE